MRSHSFNVVRAASYMVMLAAAAVLLGGVCGCSPEEVEVKVKQAALKKAMSGGVGKASARVVFGLPSDDEEKIDRVKKAVAKFVGDDGEVDVIKDSSSKFMSTRQIVARVKIPVGTKKALEKEKKASALNLIYDSTKKMFALEEGSGMPALNKALSEVEQMISVDFDGGIVKLVIVGEEVPFSVGVAAVHVNDKPLLAGTVVVKEDDVTISYDRSRGSVYNTLLPCFVLDKVAKFPMLAKPVRKSTTSSVDKRSVTTQTETTAITTPKQVQKTTGNQDAPKDDLDALLKQLDTP